MTQPTPGKRSTATVLRAAVSVLETLSFLAASVLASVDNGQDLRHAAIAACIGAVAHGVNHTSGGAPV